MSFAVTPSVQSPKAYDLANLTAAKIGVRLAAAANATLRSNLRAAQQDGGYLFNIHPLETTYGLTEAQLTFGYSPGNPMRYGADNTGATDATAAFVKAQGSMGFIDVPAGTFLLDNFAVLSETTMRCAGYKKTIIKQSATNRPAINITCDSGTGTFDAITLAYFTVLGKAGATVAAVKISATGSAALWRCLIDYCAQDTYRALEIYNGGGTNVFNNDINVRSEGTTASAFLTDSGTYNRYNLFLTNCGNSVAVDHGGVNDIFLSCVTDGQIKDSGLNTLFFAPTVENLYGTALAAGESVIQLTGNNQVLLNPTVIFPVGLGSQAKTTYALRPSTNSYVISLDIECLDSTKLDNPFPVVAGLAAAGGWTLQGGKSNCNNKMETLYDESDNDHSLAYVNFVSNVSQFTAFAEQRQQLSAPSAPFSLDIYGRTKEVLLTPTGTIATAQFNCIYGLKPGRRITFYTSQTLTAISWVSTANTALLPTTLAAGKTLTIAYNDTGNKFYPVAV